MPLRRRPSMESTCRCSTSRPGPSTPTPSLILPSSFSQRRRNMQVLTQTAFSGLPSRCYVFWSLSTSGTPPTTDSPRRHHLRHRASAARMTAACLLCPLHGLATTTSRTHSTAPPPGCLGAPVASVTPVARVVTMPLRCDAGKACWDGWHAAEGVGPYMAIHCRYNPSCTGPSDAA